MSRPSRRTTLALAVLLALGAAGTAVPARAGEGSARPIVRIDTTHRVGPVWAELTGANNDQYQDNSQGLWDPLTGAPVPDALAKIRRADVGMIRFPGGTSALEFDWQKSIGPVSERPCQKDGRHNGGPPITSVAFGVDEYMKLITAAGAQPDIMVPTANETAQHAADWVEYMNAPVGTNPNGGVAWAQVRAKNGHPAPYGVMTWEIGNEPDRGGEQDWRGDPSDPADPSDVMAHYILGGTRQQVDQVLSQGCDRRPKVSVGTGEAGEQLEVRYPPVQQDSQTITVGGEAWRAVDDLSTTGPTDRVYVFDPQSGRVTFGDGVHGALPAAGAPIRATYTPQRKPGYVDFYRAMKQVDPSIKVYSTWAPIREETGLGTADFPRFMAEHGMADDWDGIAIHPYTNFGQQSDDHTWETAREGHDQYMLGDASAARLVSALQADADRYGGRNQPVVISEFGALWFGAQRHVASFPHWETAMSHALYMASQWTHYSQDGIPWVLGNTLVSSAPTGLRAVLGGAPGFVYTADATIRQQYAPLVGGGGDTVRASVVRNPQITAVDPPPGPPTYPALTTTAAIGRDGRLRIIVVNRAPDHAVTTTVQPRGFGHTHTAEITTVAGSSYTSYNSAEHPDDVTIQATTRRVPAGAFTGTFPAHSSTVITLSPVAGSPAHGSP